MWDVEISQFFGKFKMAIVEVLFKKEFSYEECKCLQCVIFNVEKKVEKIEEEIEVVEKVMFNLEFYMQDDVVEIIKKYVDLKAVLEDVIEVWEFV